MGIWKYEGVDSSGSKVKGQLTANTEREARKFLRIRKIRPKKVIPPSILEFDISEWMVEKGFSKPFGPKDLMYFTKQLSTMINAGVPILQCFEILYTQEPNPALKKAIKNISTGISEGLSLAEAMGKQKGFSKLYVNLVRSGEIGGILDVILEKLAIHMEKQEDTKGKIKSAMIYPALVVTIGTAVIFVMVTFVVPKMAAILPEGQTLPSITQSLLDASDFLQLHWIKIIVVFVFSILATKTFIGTKEGKPLFDKFMLKVPIFGQVVLKGNLSSFTRTLATMLTSGVSLIDALEVCVEVIDNVVISKDVAKIRKDITQGKTLTEPLNKIAYFPPMITQMIQVGEQTGQIDNMLIKVADIFEQEVNHLVENMTKMLEPIILVVLGGAVGYILIAMYLPILTTAGGV